MADRRPFHSCFDERTLSYFITFCVRILRLRSTSIRLYLAAIRFYCLTHGMHDPTRHWTGARLFSIHTLLHAADKLRSAPRRSRLPVGVPLLSRLCSLLDGTFFDRYWDSLLAAVFSCAFFGFLRCGEFTTNHFNPRYHLSLSDLRWSTRQATLFLKTSKTDRTHRGVTLRLSAVATRFCPLRLLRRYLLCRSALFPDFSKSSTPLFLMPSGRALTRSAFVSRFRQLLRALGVNPLLYSGHSFRIGAASAAAAAGLPPYLIQALGRWTSDAYRRYIILPDSSIATAFCLMSSH